MSQIRHIEVKFTLQRRSSECEIRNQSDSWCETQANRRTAAMHHPSPQASVDSKPTKLDQSLKRSCAEAAVCWWRFAFNVLEESTAATRSFDDIRAPVCVQPTRSKARRLPSRKLRHLPPFPGLVELCSSCMRGVCVCLCVGSGRFGRCRHRSSQHRLRCESINISCWNATLRL